MRAQAIDDLTVRDGTVEVRPSRDLAPLVKSPFLASYGEGVDLGRVPLPVLLMPFLLNVAPAIWLSGRDAAVPVLDRRLARGLGSARDELRRLYPRARWEGRIVADELADAPEDASGDGCRHGMALLFSGGVDSTFTSLRRASERQTLIAVQGNDVALENSEGWSVVTGRLRAFSAVHGHELRSVASNFRSFLAVKRLARMAGVSSWWGHVQHGLGLIGLAAPVVESARCATLLIAATHSAPLSGGWGSTPGIDRAAAWGGVDVVHDGFESSRQDKIRFLVGRAAAGDREPFLRVCYRDKRGPGDNCTRCEKCLRTATALLLEGADPKAYGMPIGPADTVARTRAGFEGLRFAFGEGQAVAWRHLQQRARERRAELPGLSGYLAWLLDYDFEDYRRRESEGRPRKGRRPAPSESIR